MQINENINTTFNRDLAAMVRVARVANALAFATYRPGKDTFIDPDISERQQMFGAFLAAGYLRDAVKLTDELAARYSDIPAFEAMMTFALRVRDWPEVMDAMNRNPCLSLDPDGAVTEEAIGKCNVDTGSLLHSSTRCYTYEYHPAVSRFDYDILTTGLRTRMSREGVDNFVVKEMRQLAMSFHNAARAFIAALHSRLAAAGETGSLVVTT